jgi:hypothetical protein
MARQQHDKEDLLREATALVERAELQVVGFDESVVAGFRRNGSASFFFASEPVYQFNEVGELRRGYQGDQLIKAERGGLVRLQRVRADRQVQLRRHELTESELAEYLIQLDDHLDLLQARLAASEFTLLGEHPPGAEVIARVLAWLEQRPRPTPIASRPNA